MKNKVFTGIAVCCLSVVIMLTEALSVFAADIANTVNDAYSVIDGIVAWNLKKSGADSAQEWIDGTLTQGAGDNAEWYILTLSQRGNYNFANYEAALLDYLGEKEIRSASSRLKYALVLHAIGSSSDYIVSALNNSIGRQGIMSWIYGLHIINNGYSCELYSADDVLNELLSMQHDDGGWSITGEYGDVDVTAMTIQAMAPYYSTKDEVRAAVDSALSLLSSRQQEDGGYKSYGVSNPESASQVLVALSSLGIRCDEDERFIKNGNSVLDVIISYRLDDGSFAHTADGESNATATIQAMYSMLSFARLIEGRSSLYLFEPKSSLGSVSESSAESSVEPLSTSAQTITPSQDAASYKPVVCICILCGGAIVCIILVILKKRHYKNFLAAGIITAAALMIVLATDFQSADDYYNGQDAIKENVIGTVTLTIRCDTLAGKSDSEFIPSDGVILPTAEFEIEQGDSVYDILSEAARKYHIQVESEGSLNMYYISGINYLYEFDFGELSGWVYHVNGEAPSVGCGEYILSDGDEIAWLYTCDLGEDVK